MHIVYGWYFSFIAVFDVITVRNSRGPLNLLQERALFLHVDIAIALVGCADEAVCDGKAFICR